MSKIPYKETNNSRDCTNLANILFRSRYKAGLSQEHMSFELGVSKQTIINWEKGTSSPSVIQTFKWFKIVGQNPLRPFLEFLYPDTYKDIDPSSDDIKIQEALHEIIDSIPIKAQRQLAYILLGEHGSSPFSILEMITAHLHNDFKSRILACGTIVRAYEMNHAKNEVVNPDNVLPDIEMLNKSMKLAEEAYTIGKSGYGSNKINET